MPSGRRAPTFPLPTSAGSLTGTCQNSSCFVTTRYAISSTPSMRSSASSTSRLYLRPRWRRALSLAAETNEFCLPSCSCRRHLRASTCSCRYRNQRHNCAFCNYNYQSPIHGAIVDHQRPPFSSAPAKSVHPPATYLPPPMRNDCVGLCVARRLSEVCYG